MKKAGLFIVLFLSFRCFAQDMRGVVISSADNKPLANVSIVIPEEQKGVLTGSDGKFILTDAGGSAVHLQASLLGYKTFLTIVHPATDSNEITIRLEVNAGQLEEVIVTANNSGLQNNIPYTVNTFSMKQLAAGNQPSLMQMLAEKPGIDRISQGNGIGKPVIRGLSFNRVMLYSMGTRVENQPWDDDHDLGIAETGLDNVEVVYGPAALIYGAGALGGVLIFNNEKPAPGGKTIGDVNLSLFSNTAGINGDAGIKGTGRKGLFYIVRAGGQSHADYEMGGKEAEAENSRFAGYNAKASMGLSRKWSVTKISYSYLQALTGMIEDESADTLGGKSKPAGDEEEGESREMELPYQDVVTHIVACENTVLFQNSKFNFNIAYQYNNRREWDEPSDSTDDPALDIGLKLHTFTYDVKWTSDPQRKVGITAGSQGMFQMNRNFGGRVRIPDVNTTDFAGYAVLRYDATAKLNLLGGVRVDVRQINAIRTPQNKFADINYADSIARQKGYMKPDSVFTRHYNPASFSFGAAYHPLPAITIKANAATGFSAPDYAELSSFGIHEGTYRFEVGRSNLALEQNVEADLGFAWELKDISVSVSGFYNSIRNYTFIQPTKDFIELFRIYSFIQQDATITGGSAGIYLHPVAAKWLYISSAATVTRGELKGGGYLPFMPADKIITEIKLQKEKLWRAEHVAVSVKMNNHFALNHVAEYETTTAGYTLFDVVLSSEWRIHHQTIGLSLFCTNLFNKAYYNNLSLIKDLHIYEMGRNFGLRLHVPFVVK